ncbi:acetoacetate--CoA ligase [Rhodospirillum rubrum]|uniref:acetoacetate--CoA ligase n=1 Tax=Rhodospirillum rubrum TaxID=1085 RepID=UPI001904B783|nr:acetoacetate--CoA ligase [Rhodospirillum rubrum]MBK1663508.1 acetoacetate--CoA ligase [Rhodospirillum rubrum]MBK1675706.1 acetoacetate--CoA ligase [Rhodospirillum rubrum]
MTESEQAVISGFAKGEPAPPLWTPSAERIAATRLDAFRRHIEERHGVVLADYDALWQWSIEAPAAFWNDVWDFCGVIGDKGDGPVVDDPGKLPGARWFAGARLNAAETLLAPHAQRPGDAVVFRVENHPTQRLDLPTLRARVSLVQQGLRRAGVGVGDRVAGYLPNMPEALIAMLATAGLGAVWSSASPDFGAQGVIDRFGQIEPKVLFTVDGYFYNGKVHDCREKVATLVKAVPSITQVVEVAFAGKGDAPDAIPRATSWANFIGDFTAGEPDFLRLPFDHPLYILYSSGTTGVPKCIVHGHGGTLLQQLKEHVLHADAHPGDRVFYFTTCGWMMWNWLAAALGAGCTVLLYDGSPFYPDGTVLWDYAQAEGCTFFGTSAKWIDAQRKAGLRPGETHDLSTVRVIASTGSPLAPESFDYVYDAIKGDVQLASISGGTDILSCFMLGSPIDPVFRGEIQKRGLGMAVAVFDDEGRPLVGEKGELVCTRAFPSSPIGFWNDADGAKFKAAYFERFPGVWTHGDWVELTPHGGIIVYGRSDATLNPGGVRIGTAEIYRQVETLDEVREAIVIGQDWQGDVRVVLFVVLRDGLTLTPALEDAIKARIRQSCTPRHVPAKVVQVNDIPRTKSNKIVELAVREVVHGRPVRNREALANPEALDDFAGRPELAG